MAWFCNIHIVECLRFFENIYINNGTFDQLFVSKNPDLKAENRFDDWDYDTILNADFDDGTLEAGNSGFSLRNTDYVVIKCRQVGDLEWRTIYTKKINVEEDFKINIKDYIEVNSAISLALQGLEYGLANMNFNKKNTWEQLKEALGSDITIGGKKGKDNGKKKININLNSPKVKQWVMRDFFGVLVLLVVYGGLATYINYGMQDKEKEISNTKADINTQITLIDRDKEKINSKTSEYTTLTTNLQNASDAANTKNAYKNVITTFLSEIMYVIPKEVVLTSIENPNARKIVINAQSEKYEQLAYFKALLKSKGVLEPSSVVSSEATKEGSTVKIVIEGELPWKTF